MKVYTCNNFRGHHPVGTAAVVVAPNRVRAEVLLELELERIGLPQPRHFQLDLIELPSDYEGVSILNNGDY